MSSSLGTLWITATPLGNSADFSPRARKTVEEAAVLLAEDTRRTGRLLAELGITAPPLVSFHDHNEEAKLEEVVALLESGKDVALVSDAGTPLLSDPGYRLVKACRTRGLRVSPVPGPSAPTAALCASGLPPLPYVFLGFAPRKNGEREAFFAPYAALPATLIFFERKDRVKETLSVAFPLLGPRDACVARELTKTYEEFICFALADYASLPDDLLGEITVLVGPPIGGKDSDDKVTALIREERARGGKPRDVARRVQARVTGWTGKEIYELARTAGAAEE